MTKPNEDFMYIENLYFSGKKLEAFDKCSKLAKNGNLFCIRFMGYFFYKGEVVEKDFSKAYEWFLKAAQKGDHEAYYGLGAVEYIIKNYNKYFYFFKVSYECGFLPASYRVGLMCYAGIGTEKNLDKACFYFNKGIETGSVFSLRAKASILLKGREGNLGRVIGFYLLLKSVYQAFVIALHDRHDQRLSH